MRLFGFPEDIRLNPREWRNIGWSKDFTDVTSGVRLNTDTLTLTGYERAETERWIYERYGRNHAIPARAELDLGNGAFTSFDYMLDLKGLRFTDEDAVMGIKPLKGTDNFYDRASNTTFTVVRQEGFITDDMLFDVPYLIQQEDAGLQAAMLIAASISLVQQAINALFEIAKLAADALDVVGTGVLTTVAKAIALTAWFAFSVISVIQNAVRLKELLFPKKRYFKACTDFNLITAGLNYLGYTFDSGFFADVMQAATLPVPVGQEGQSIFDVSPNDLTGFFNYGWPTALDTTPTIWSLLDYYRNFYNLRIFVHNGVVRLEPKEAFMGSPLIKIKKTFSKEVEKQKEWTYNENANWSRKYVSWTFDFTDKYSPDSSGGMQAEYVPYLTNMIDIAYVSFDKMKDVIAPFSLAGRKKSLNFAEKVAREFLEFIDTLVSAFGGASSLASNIDDRIGVMLVSTQFFSTTKKLWVDVTTGKQTPDYLEKLNCDNIVQLYHQNDEIQNNTFKSLKMRVPFTSTNFQLLLQNNFIEDADGEVAEVLKVDWEPWKNSATFMLQVEDGSAFNVQTKKVA